MYSHIMVGANDIEESGVHTEGNITRAQTHDFYMGKGFSIYT